MAADHAGKAGKAQTRAPGASFRQRGWWQRRCSFSGRCVCPCLPSSKSKSQACCVPAEGFDVNKVGDARVGLVGAAPLMLACGLRSPVSSRRVFSSSSPASCAEEGVAYLQRQQQLQQPERSEMPFAMSAHRT